MSIHQQIEWVQSRVYNMKKSHPGRIAEGSLTPERSAYLIALAEETLLTLSQLRGIVLRTERNNHE